MQTQTTRGDDRFDVEDVAAAIREGRSLRPAALYRIVVMDDQLHERHIDLSDPVPTGRQILQASGARPADEYSVYAILTSGDFEDLRLDETYDLRGRGAERFVIFQTDRAFKFTIDDRQLEWGKPSISGCVLKALAGVPPETYDVYLEVRGGGQDILIRDGDLIDLGKPGIERFITLIRDTTEGLLTLPEADQRYLSSHGMSFEMVGDGVHTGVIFKQLPLSLGGVMEPGMGAVMAPAETGVKRGFERPQECGFLPDLATAFSLFSGIGLGLRKLSPSITMR
ncbi:multiubiquitin family protein [Burkholderia gladioli]|uniref:Multiubiquitin family protein n=1 Tax=Burkholderia gladioli TaxID=28095 RepID=A0AAW3ESD4_BURGA|nr:multiubiquitin domain-containing protein [Burkholderia gladioli]KGC09991.1 multiubiquitin family protein [Burkholderia gladioli]